MVAGFDKISHDEWLTCPPLKHVGLAATYSVVYDFQGGLSSKTASIPNVLVGKTTLRKIFVNCIDCKI